jgi:hypothetical protein
MRSPGVVAACLVAASMGCSSDPARITVAGKVFPPPGPGAQVVIGGKSATPDPATGAFTITSVTAPYDLVAIVSGATAKTGVLYKELTRPDPTIFASASAPPESYSAIISGTITGGVVPQPNVKTRVTYGSPELDYRASAVVGGGLTYSLQPGWSGPASTTGSLHALQLETASSSDARPSAYHGYGEKAGITLANQGNFAGQDVAMAPVSSSHLTGTLTVPDGYSLSMTFADVVFADGSGASLFYQTVPAGAFDYLMPSIAGATGQLSVSASSSAGSVGLTRSQLALDANGVELSFQAPPAQSAPDDASTGVTTATVFSWQPFTRGVHVVGFGSAVPGSPRFAVITMASSATIPDLAALGVALPKGATYSWRVEAYAPFASLDEAADLKSIVNEHIQSRAETAYEGTSKVRSFTTAP